MRPVLLGFVGGPVLMIAVAYLWTHQGIVAWMLAGLAALFVAGLFGEAIAGVAERRQARADEVERQKHAVIAALDADTPLAAGPVRGAPTERAG